MLIQQAYKFELMPTGAQARQLRNFAGSCRFVYNKALRWQIEQYAQDPRVKFSYTRLANFLPLWKVDANTAWLREAPSQALQQALKQLESSYLNFFAKRADFPKFKKRGHRDSFRIPQGFNVDEVNHRVFIPKLGWLRYRHSRDMLGIAKNITISQANGKWFAAIQTAREVDGPVHTNSISPSSAIGIDVGIARFATMSDGTYLEPISSFKKHEKRLARYQRATARKVKFSQNWKKAKTRVAKLHTRIANVRRDYLHKASSQLSKSHALIVIEDLKVSNMSKSAKGSIEVNGKNVKAKSGLNKAILDQAWFEFRRQLEYKQRWLGGELLAVPAHYSSQRCSCCGTIDKANRQSQAKFECVSCGYQANADVNAANNILAAGYAVLACGVTVLQDRTVKQEPTEVTSHNLVTQDD
jgi:putative transposase